LDKRYITGTIFLLIAIVLALSFIEPKYEEIKFVSNGLIEKEREAEGQRFLIREVGNLSDEFASTLKEISKFDSLLPSSINIADLLVQMDYIVSRNGLIINNIDFSDTSKRAVKSFKYSSVNVRLNVTGSYNAFLNFSEDIKNNYHLMNINRLSVSSVESDLGPEEDLVLTEPIFTFDMDIEVYYQ